MIWQEQESPKKFATNPEHKGLYTSPLLVEEDSLKVINVFGDSLFWEGDMEKLP